MRLKKLEIYGFKSFADRVEMIFPDGVTGVVGPNGSGKSNIGDAVRWVLGEQSAKTLRGAKMEDVIFGGTEKRKAQAYCEVSLVFDNSDGKLPVDYAEVMITRRVYRSGDSEYYLNKSPCRLRDIIDLMRDTGIGKEGYSLIGQGRIDEILSVKSEERRNVFEEAAGITKYKARKAEAERRMENTADNLSRVEDILNEVGARLPELENQAGNAREYMKLTDELRRLEISSFAHNHDRLTDSLEQAEAQSESLNEQIQILEANDEALRADNREKEQGILDAEAHIAELNRQILDQTRSCEIIEGDLGVLRERIASAEKDIARLENENEQAQLRGGELVRQRAESHERRNTLASELEQIRAHCRELSERVEKAAADVQLREETIEQGKEEMIRSFNALSDVKSASARLTATREGLTQRLSVLKEGGRAGREAVEAAQREVESAQKKLDDARADLDELQKKRAEALARQGALQAENQQLGGSIQRTGGALREAQSRLKMLEQMQRDYEGYQNSVREVLRRFAGREGVYGVVAGIVHVPREIERAVEMALGGAMQNIVCDREEDAKVMIDYLRANRMGRATFLPLSSVRGRVLSAQERQVLRMDGCVGLASELVQYDEKFRPVVENLLGRTVVARDLDAGIAIMRAGRHAFRLVTLEGDVMHSGGSMTGGSVNARSTSILSRQREIDEHRAAAKSLSEKLDALNKRVETIKNDLTEAQRHAAAAGEAVHQQDIAVLREQEGVKFAKGRAVQAEQAQSCAALEREQLEESIREIDDELEAMQARTGQAEQASVTTQEDIARATQQLSDKRQALEQLRAELAERRATEAGKQAELENAQRDEQRFDGSRQELESAAAIRRRSGEALRQRAEKDRAALEEKQQDVAKRREMLENTQNALRAEETRREELRVRASELNDRMEASRRQREEAQEALHRVQMMQSRWTAELKQLQDRIWERYELTLENARPFCDPDYDESASRGCIDALRQQVRALGSVNVGALQEYEETRTRYEEMDQQRADLRKAQRDLEEIVSDLVRKMEKQFTEQFKLLNEHFSRTFTQLFGGGTAMLKLQDEKDVLGCGIDIDAQPPGKKLQLLSLLSGGERALTAIAILFAMLDIRPSPFCILDEIEAALDEANVANFADYLKQYSHDTQFIVVTHRKGTMERCDALYGVAMEEKGVSRMVSVQLSELQKQLEDESNDLEQ